METLCWPLRGLAGAAEEEAGVWERTHRKRPELPRLWTRAHAHSHMRVDPGRDRQRHTCLGCCDSDSKEAKLTKERLALQFPKSPPLSVFLNDSEAAQYVWLGFSLALSYPVGGRKKERKDQISVPLNCPGFVQPTVIVRLSLWVCLHPQGGLHVAQGLHLAQSKEQLLFPMVKDHPPIKSPRSTTVTSGLTHRAVSRNRQAIIAYTRVNQNKVWGLNEPWSKF